MEQNTSRGRGRSFNDSTVELRRPNTNSSCISENRSFANAAAGVNPQISAPSSNLMPTSLPPSTGDFVSPVSRTENISYGYTFSSEAVNVPSKSQSHTHLDPRIKETVKNSKLSPLAKEFVPKTFVQGEAPAPSGSTVPSQLEYMVCLVHEFIYEVTLNPGKFDEEVILLTESLNVIVKNVELTKALIEIIFKQAIQEPNFRYNGARLCNHLNRNLVSDSQGHSFRYFLLEKCQFEYEQRDMLIKCNPPYLRGLIFFFGELYSQILNPSETKIDILRNAIICLLDALLTEPSQDNIKCICQVIKMTGANLEDHERLLNSQEGKPHDFMSLDKIFEKLKNLNARDLQTMVTNVIQLRGMDWGRSSIPVQTQQPPPQHVLHGGAVFYGPDGQPITSEEALFLESQSYFDCRLDTYDEDFNDEIAADYESFLREIGQ